MSAQAPQFSDFLKIQFDLKSLKKTYVFVRFLVAAGAFFARPVGAAMTPAQHKGTTRGTQGNSEATQGQHSGQHSGQHKADTGAARGATRGQQRSRQGQHKLI